MLQIKSNTALTLSKRQATGLLGEEDMAFNKKKSSKSTEIAKKRIQSRKPSVIATGEKADSEALTSAVSVQEKIALLAYYYWEQRGRPGDSPDEDWFRAEQEIFIQMNISK